jgi:hypothetical protein
LLNSTNLARHALDRRASRQFLPPSEPAESSDRRVRAARAALQRRAEPAGQRRGESPHSGKVRPASRTHPHRRWNQWKPKHGAIRSTGSGVTGTALWYRYRSRREPPENAPVGLLHPTILRSFLLRGRSGEEQRPAVRSGRFIHKFQIGDRRLGRHRMRVHRWPLIAGLAKQHDAE